MCVCVCVCEHKCESAGLMITFLENRSEIVHFVLCPAFIIRSALSVCVCVCVCVCMQCVPNVCKICYCPTFHFNKPAGIAVCTYAVCVL